MTRRVEVREIFYAGEGDSGGPGGPRAALTLASSRRAVPRRCRTTRDIRAHLWARGTGAATGGTPSFAHTTLRTDSEYGPGL
jgi:hypothetical protein